MKDNPSPPVMVPVTAGNNPPQTATPAPLPRLAFSLRECAAMMGISYVSVWRLVQRGKLKSTGHLRHKLISKAELERFLKA